MNFHHYFKLVKMVLKKTLLIQVKQALEARELIKIKVLENSGLESRETSDMICKAVKCEGVQAIGNKIVLYKQSSDLKKRKIELPTK